MKERMMSILNITENDPRAQILGGWENINENAASIINGDTVTEAFLQPLMSHLTDNSINESIITTLLPIIILHRNDPSKNPEYLLQHPNNKFADIERQLFDVLTTLLQTEDVAVVSECTAAVSALFQTIGIKAPQTLLIQLIENTKRFCATNNQGLVSDTLFAMLALLANASRQPNWGDLNPDQTIVRFTRDLPIMPITDIMYKNQVKSYLDQLSMKLSFAELWQMTIGSIASTNNSNGAESIIVCSPS